MLSTYNVQRKIVLKFHINKKKIFVSKILRQIMYDAKNINKIKPTYYIFIKSKYIRNDREKLGQEY